MYPKRRKNELIDLVIKNSGRIESLSKCCGGGGSGARDIRGSMEKDIFEMDQRIAHDWSYEKRDTFIFGSWRRKSRTNGRKTRSDAGRSGSKEARKHAEEIVPSSQRSSAYRPASYGSSLSEGRSAGRSSISEIGRDEDYPRCPRCEGRMIEPRILECLHSICTPCVDELLERAGSECREKTDETRRFSYQRRGCPVCDYPLPQPGSPMPPPHYPLQHRLVLDAIRRRLPHRVLCCDVCLEEVQASVHCPTCLGNFCSPCGSQHAAIHPVGPLWEAKRFRRTALCLEHPCNSLRFHCIACGRVTCRECVWRGAHRGHATESVADASPRTSAALVQALERARNRLNSLLTEYDGRSFSREHHGASSTPRRPRIQFRRSPGSYAREARERIYEFARLQKARYLLDAVSLGEELLAEGSHVEILSLGAIVLQRLRILEAYGRETNADYCRDETEASGPRHEGIFHCCTFCSSGGRKEATCACRGTMPGGYRGCGHGHPGHPRVHHWSCCGSIERYGRCTIPLPKSKHRTIL